MRTVVVAAAVALALAVAVVVVACPEPNVATCQSAADCAAVDPAPCERCAPLATALCLEGACAGRPADAVDVTATFNVDRRVTATGLAFAVGVRGSGAGCPGAGFAAFPADLSALSSGQLTLSGGTFHPDVPLGRAPEGTVLLFALATSEPAAEGVVVASGCAQATLAAPSTAILPLNLLP